MEVFARVRPALKTELASGNSLLSVRLDTATQNITLTPASEISASAASNDDNNSVSNGNNNNNNTTNHNSSQVSLLSDPTQQIAPGSASAGSRSFKVDTLLDHTDPSPSSISTNQSLLYNQFNKRHIRRSLSGLSTSIVIVGPASSGKSYTAHGRTSQGSVINNPDDKSFTSFALSNGDLDQERAGIIPRTVHGLFEEARRKNYKHPAVGISMCCVYDERVTDLLDPTSTRAASGGKNVVISMTQR